MVRKIRKFLFVILASMMMSQGLNAQMTLQTADVCVYGATSSGVMAAYAAAKSGKTVLLIEPSGHLGGLTAGGLGYSDIGNKYVITGLARDFYRRIGQHYGKFEQWIFEPHVASKTFEYYLNDANLSVLYKIRLLEVKKAGTVISEVIFEQHETGKKIVIKAKVYIDCTYEGDLMAGSKVRYVVGREDNTLYGETYNGVQLREHHQFPDGIDPYKEEGNPTSGLLWGISSAKLALNGTADKNVQAYNFRLCLTNNPANRLSIARPVGYDSTKYELLLRLMKANPEAPLKTFFKWDDIPNYKTDINNNGAFSTDMIVYSKDYPDGDYNTRARIVAQHESYVKGLLYFLGNDERVSKKIKTEMLQWGYPKDEFENNHNFTPQLYVREARRMIGEYVMTQANCVGEKIVDDGIGYAAYTMDSHNCQRLVVNDANGRPQVKNEGDVQIGGFPPYPISYRSLVPKSNECTNLLVPVCLSASHIAFGSIRMEPVFMVLGQVAGVAASLAIDLKTTIQDLSISGLRKELSSNPLSNGSIAELLIDGDLTPEMVQVNGNWKKQNPGISQFGGCYGPSLFISDATEKASSVRFNAKIKNTANYKVYFYNSGRMKEKSQDVTIKIQSSRFTEKHVNLATDHPDDWIDLGEYRFEKGKPAFVEVFSNKTGWVVADAILFVPINGSN